MTDTTGAVAAVTDDVVATQELQASADHLRDVLDAIDSGTLEATRPERAFIAGSLATLELVNGPRP